MSEATNPADSGYHDPSTNGVAKITDVASLNPTLEALAVVTPRRPQKGVPFALPPGGKRFSVWTELGRLAAYHAGQGGPTICLVHGWEGSSADFNAFVPVLLNRGFSIVAVDFSAHGESEGRIATIPECARALLALQSGIGRFDAVIAHSMGCGFVTEALTRGLAVDQVVLIASPRRFLDHIMKDPKRQHWSSDDLNSVLAALNRLGVDTPVYDLPKQVAGFKQSALIMHSDNDQVCPMRFGQEISRAWIGSIFAEMPGLGHRRILGDLAAVRLAIDFIAPQSSCGDD